MSLLIVRILTLLGILSACQSFDLNATTQLPNYIVPEHYTVELDFNKIEKGFYGGTCLILIRLDRPAESIHFHSHTQQIEVHYLTKMNSRRSYTPTRSAYHETSNIVSIYFANKLSEGHYILEMDFKTILINDVEKNWHKTFYINEEGSRVWLLGMTGARGIFPCWDKPDFEAIFNISAKHLSKHTVLSNMPVQITDKHKHLTWTYFDETPLISPHFLEIVVSEYSFISNRINERINFRYREQAASYLRYAKMIIENVTLHLESQWKHCKKLAKVDYVALPGRYHINKSGFVLYREEDLFCDEELDLVIYKAFVAVLVARAVVPQQCLNKLVSFSSSQPLWLRDAILTLYAVNTINKIFPEFRMWNIFVVKIHHETLRLDSITKPFVSEPNSTEIDSTLFFNYSKAPVIFRMLQHVLGDDVFWNGTEIFLNREYKSSPSLDDFWTAMQIALDNSNNVYKFNIKNMINPWIKLKRYPVLYVEQYNVSHVKISNKNALEQTVEVPLTFTTQDNSNFINTSPYLFMSVHRTVYLSLNLNGWIIMNIQQAGYYRVNYDATYWGRIIHYLKTDEFTKIHVLNRAQLIDDAFYFYINKQLPLSTFWELTEYLHRETDFIAWCPMFNALQYMFNNKFSSLEKGVHIKAQKVFSYIKWMNYWDEALLAAE